LFQKQTGAGAPVNLGIVINIAVTRFFKSQISNLKPLQVHHHGSFLRPHH
jgi:hypothetical protein